MLDLDEVAATLNREGIKYKAFNKKGEVQLIFAQDYRYNFYFYKNFIEIYIRPGETVSFEEIKFDGLNAEIKNLIFYNIHLYANFSSELI